MDSKWQAWVIRSVLALVFVTAAIVKLVYPATGSHTESRVLSFLNSRAAQYVTAEVEFATAILLMTPMWVPGLWIGLSLSLAFLAISVGLEVSGLGVAACGCFGKANVGAFAHLGILFGMGLLCLSGLSLGVRPRMHGPDATEKDRRSD